MQIFSGFGGALARRCGLLCCLVLFAVSGSALAQVIPPSAQPGRERQQFQQPTPPPAVHRSPMIVLPSTVAPAGAAKIKLKLNGVVVSGSTVYTSAELAPLYSKFVGKRITVGDLYLIARRITAKYGADGYVLSRAIVPPQTLNPKGSTVHIRIVEGYIDRVEWPKGLGHYRDFFSQYAAKITASRPANIHVIERYLLLASDLPGLKFSSSLQASKVHPAASTLVVQVTKKPFDFVVRLDNRGTRERGPFEYLMSGSINNALGLDEQITLTAAGTVPFKELQYFEGRYLQVLNSEGLTFFADASYGFGRPGTQPLERLRYDTNTLYARTGLSYPFIRQRDRNLTFTGLAFLSNSRAEILSQTQSNDRLRGVRVKVDGNYADAWGGVSQLNITYSQGIPGLGATRNGNPYASRAAGRVDFRKIEATLSHTQPLSGDFSAYGALYGQWAFNPLLSPEQCGYGGRYFGRAFDVSQFLGDRCFEALGELRYNFSVFRPWVTQTQVYTFADYGALQTLDPAPGTPGAVHAASVGVGLRIAAIHNISIDAQVARGIEGPSTGWRAFGSLEIRY